MATYYVDPVSGSNGNAGTSIGAAWATTQYAADNAPADSNIYLMATGSETPSATIDIDTASRQRFIGTNASGVVDGTNYVITDTSLTSGNPIIKIDGASRGVLRNVELVGTGNANRCVDVPNDTGDDWDFFQCEFRGATSDGIRFASKSRYSFHMFSIYNNGGNGIECNTSGDTSLFYCTVHNNTSNGVSMWSSVVAIRSLIYGNGADGILTNNGSLGGPIIGCTISDNGSDGIVDDRKFQSSTIPLLINNAITNNGGYGVRFNDQTPAVLLQCSHNLYHNNTSGESNATLGDWSFNNITGDNPDYVDAANDDFTPASGSPLIDAGLGGYTIGALEPADSGGGGGKATSIIGGMIVRG